MCICVCTSTWSTDGGLDASLLQNRNSVDGTLNMLREYIPVQVKQAEGKVIGHLGNKTAVMYVRTSFSNSGQTQVCHFICPCLDVFLRITVQVNDILQEHSDFQKQVL